MPFFFFLDYHLNWLQLERWQTQHFSTVTDNHLHSLSSFLLMVEIIEAASFLCASGKTYFLLSKLKQFLFPACRAPGVDDLCLRLPWKQNHCRWPTPYFQNANVSLLRYNTFFSLSLWKPNHLNLMLFCVCQTNSNEKRNLHWSTSHAGFHAFNICCVKLKAAGLIGITVWFNIQITGADVFS